MSAYFCHKQKLFPDTTLHFHLVEVTAAESGSDHADSLNSAMQDSMEEQEELTASQVGSTSYAHKIAF